jgi:hypothetical protein
MKFRESVSEVGLCTKSRVRNGRLLEWKFCLDGDNRFLLKVGNNSQHYMEPQSKMQYLKLLRIST